MAFRSRNGKRTSFPDTRSPSTSGYPPPSSAHSSEWHVKYLIFLKDVGSSIEETIENWLDPIRPYLPAIGRFLTVATFYEDSWRISRQWETQNEYLQQCVHLTGTCNVHY
jgi:hypothetical protein